MCANSSAAWSMQPETTRAHKKLQAENKLSYNRKLETYVSLPGKPASMDLHLRALRNLQPPKFEGQMESNHS